MGCDELLWEVLVCCCVPAALRCVCVVLIIVTIVTSATPHHHQTTITPPHPCTTLTTTMQAKELGTQVLDEGGLFDLIPTLPPKVSKYQLQAEQVCHVRLVCLSRVSGLPVTCVWFVCHVRLVCLSRVSHLLGHVL